MCVCAYMCTHYIFYWFFYLKNPAKYTLFPLSAPKSPEPLTVPQPEAKLKLGKPRQASSQAVWSAVIEKKGQGEKSQGVKDKPLTPLTRHLPSEKRAVPTWEAVATGKAMAGQCCSARWRRGEGSQRGEPGILYVPWEQFSSTGQAIHMHSQWLPAPHTCTKRNW